MILELTDRDIDDLLDDLDNAIAYLEGANIDEADQYADALAYWRVRVRGGTA